MQLAAEEPIIRVTGFTAAWGDQVVLGDLDFEVGRGEVFAILGGSGSGKSTLLKHLIGLHRPAAGQVWIGDEELVRTEGERRIALLRRIGVTYQSDALFGSMTVLGNVTLPLELHTSLPRDARDLVARLKLHAVGLAEFAGYMPAELSGGMKKRAAIARAMALDPEILFLDEPSAGLDPVTSAELDELILDLVRGLGITFVIVTHELASIYRIADRVIVLDQRTKGIIASGDPREIRDRTEDPWVRSFFRGEPLRREGGER